MHFNRNKNGQKNTQRKDGTFPIKMKVEHDGKHLNINLKTYAKIETWTGQKLNSKHPNYKRANNELLKKLTTATTLIEDYEQEICTWNCEQLRDFIAHSILEAKSEHRDKKLREKGATLLMTPTGVKTMKLFKHGQDMIGHCNKLKLYGRAKSYCQALSAFERYTPYDKDITFAQITARVLEEWKNTMINKPMKDTSYNAYLRGLRAIINDGIKTYKLPREGNYGFEYFTVGTPENTQKRAITIDEIKRLLSHSLPIGTSLWHTQLQAIFLFNTNGINFIDMAYLRMNNIMGDFERVHYIRAKTHKKFDVVTAGRSKEILKYYAQGKTQGSDELIFPILPQEILGQGRKEITLYESQRKVFNGNLKKIAKLCGIDKNITSYVLRHSFATALKRSGTDISLISEALGHESEKTTQIYLDSFDKQENDKVTQSIAI
jgi:site-specific recombinase XerD